MAEFSIFDRSMVKFTLRVNVYMGLVSIDGLQAAVVGAPQSMSFCVVFLQLFCYKISRHQCLGCF